MGKWHSDGIIVIEGNNSTLDLGKQYEKKYRQRQSSDIIEKISCQVLVKSSVVYPTRTAEWNNETFDSNIGIFLYIVCSQI